MSQRTCKFEGCKATCAWEGLYEDKPCWGEIQIVESFPDPEGSERHIHGCQGHENMWNGEYQPELKHKGIAMDSQGTLITITMTIEDAVVIFNMAEHIYHHTGQYQKGGWELLCKLAKQFPQLKVDYQYILKEWAQHVQM